jgi:hypothetical protein
MTHTSGFEEVDKDMWLPDTTLLRPLGTYVKTHLPVQIFQPGTIPAYSNYGAALAAYIVQRLSGEPFEQYVERHIFRPLGMMHSTFRQPIPESLARLMSESYAVASASPRPFEFIGPAPAGGLASSATDLARFMIVHLQNGQYGETAILKPSTAIEMHRRQFAMHPQADGMCLGFPEDTRNGRRSLRHPGGTLFFSSDLRLMLDANLGLFVSYNSFGRQGGGFWAADGLWGRFLDRYFPSELPRSTTPAHSATDVRIVSGHYLASRRSHTTITKTAYLLLLGEATVAAGKDGELLGGGIPIPDEAENPSRWQEIAPRVYRHVNGQVKLIFKEGSDGRLQMIVSSLPPIIFQRVPWYASAGFVKWIGAATLIILILTLMLWPVGRVLRWRYGHKPDVSRPGRLRIWVRFVCVTDLAFALGWLGTIVYAYSDPSHQTILTARLDPWWRLLQALGWIGLAGTVLALLNSYRSWTDKTRHPWTRLHDTLIAVACVSFAWLIVLLKCLNFSVKY